MSIGEKGAAHWGILIYAVLVMGKPPKDAHPLGGRTRIGSRAAYYTSSIMNSRGKEE